MFPSRRLHIHFFFTVGNFTTLHFSFRMRLRFIVKHNFHTFNVSSTQLVERCGNVYFFLISKHINLCGSISLHIKAGATCIQSISVSRGEADNVKAYDSYYYIKCCLRLFA